MRADLCKAMSCDDGDPSRRDRLELAVYLPCRRPNLDSSVEVVRARSGASRIRSGARGAWSQLPKEAASGADDPWTIVDDTEFVVGMCHVCLSRHYRDSCAWANRDDRDLVVKCRVVVRRASYTGSGVGRHAWADRADDHAATRQLAQIAKVLLGQHFGARRQRDNDCGRQEMEPVDEDLIG